ncbi:hypothetical protein [Rhodohalobacter sulfatireducens]|nr:hypothetical protein [Rhodohalobacter sulfatireducens]
MHPLPTLVTDHSITRDGDITYTIELGEQTWSWHGMAVGASV